MEGRMTKPSTMPCIGLNQQRIDIGHKHLHELDAVDFLLYDSFTPTVWDVGHVNADERDLVLLKTDTGIEKGTGPLCGSLHSALAVREDNPNLCHSW
jgi:hypothetical protein